MPSLEDANCVGVPPVLFDVDTKNPREAWRAASPALAYCATCPVKRECVEHMDPAGNGSSTVAGGIVWVKGEPFTPNITFKETPPTADELMLERFGKLSGLRTEFVQRSKGRAA